ncbi:MULTISPECIES: DUF3192 domain-containing protein [Gammaproteobacteria]|uniref:DUF3192 domain-containing protein n=1 Tax=Gammaproteobacteria TaxID=1236 RepID=UPI000DD06D75|nr:MULTISPECIES: DUF3192 domain-containing protein [Gammaproteobacteria]RTE87372.1 DUF3192 domain-containing protein [Aliidiomarina sp. B3213]TCZ92842.1 DUF3192 domain-containing protein [Lysobacter sp. N42]
MKNNVLKGMVAGLAALSLSACVVVVDGNGDEDGSWQSQERENRRSIARLDLGVTPNSVIQRMGIPEFDENLSVDGSTYRVLYYRTQRVSGDGVTTKDECTPLVFMNNELLGWGEAKLDSIR